MANMKDLIEAIDTLMPLLGATPKTVYLSDSDFREAHPNVTGQIDNITGLASELLILEDGRNSVTNHQKLKEHGYPVTCGESDSFGWLSGVINTPHGRLVYF